MAQFENQELIQHKECLIKKAEELIFKEIPLKIIELNNLLQTPKFNKQNFSDFYPVMCISRKITEQQTNILSVTLQSNKCIIDLVETIQPYIAKLLKDVKIIQIWICFIKTKFEVEKNFRAKIQEKILALVQDMEDSAKILHEKIPSYFVARAKIMKNVLTHPEIEEFHETVKTLDEGTYISFCLGLTDIRNEYLALYDVVLNNIDKLKTPLC